MSRGLLRNKIPQLQQALEGRVTGHHRFLLRELLDHLYFVECKMQRIEQEIAWAVSRKKNNYLAALSHRLAARRGRKRAVIAVAHNLLVIAYYILRDGTCYCDLGPDYFDAMYAAAQDPWSLHTR